MIIGFGNNVVSSLAADITASQTTIQVMPGTGAMFANLLTSDYVNSSNPLKTYAKITLTDAKETAFEVCHLTAVNIDMLTVIRGQEGTTAKGWSLNDVIANFATRGSENQFVQIEELQSGHYVAGVAGGTENNLTLELPATYFVNGGADWTLRTPLVVIPALNNTGPSTLQLTMGGRVLGKFPLYKGNKAELSANDIIKDAPVLCVLDNTRTYFSVLNPLEIYLGSRYLQKDQNGRDIPDKAAFVKNVGAARAYGRDISLGAGEWTTSEFVAWLKAKGAFDQPYWMMKASLPASMNKVITDTGLGKINLGGCAIEVMGTYDAAIVRVTIGEYGSPGFLNGTVCTCTVYGSTQYFHWRVDYSTKNKPTAADTGAVSKTGDKMTGELKIGTMNALRIFNDAFGLIFRRSEDFLHFIPTAEGQGENGDIGPLRPFAINLKTGTISASHGAKIDGGLALGTDNALGGNSITLGDNDTGIKQAGDGVLLFYSNGQPVFRLQPASADFYKRVAYTHQGVVPEGSGAFADQLNNATAPFVQTQFAWNPVAGGHYVPIVKGLSIRNGQGYPGAVSFGYLLPEQQGFPIPCIHMCGDNGADALWQFNPNDKSFISPGPVIAGGATLAANGDIHGTVWGGWLSSYLRQIGVQDVRLGSQQYYEVNNWQTWNFQCPSGHVLSGINVQDTGSNSADNIAGVYYRPVQKYINGNWYNVVSV